MGRARHWSRRERALLAEHYPTCGPQETSKILAAHGYDDRDPRVVKNYANKLGIKWEDGNPNASSEWSSEEDRLLARAYPSGGWRATSGALVDAGYRRRGRESIRWRAKVLGVVRGEKKRDPKPNSPNRRGTEARHAILNRPLTADSIELIHFYAARGCSPERTAREINRPLDVVKRVLRETKPAKAEPVEWWPTRDGILGGRLPRYMTNTSKQAQTLSA